MRLALLLVVVVVAACDHKADTRLSATHYDRACKSGGDCVPIFEGEITSCQEELACPNAAIAQDELITYAQDVTNRLAPCPNHGVPSCGGSQLTCVSGQCEFHDGGMDTYSISTAAYDKTCVDTIDCVGVYEGPLGCCDVPCFNAVISGKGEAAYKAELARRAPFCYPPPPCPAPIGGHCTGRIDCLNGQCVLLGATP